MLGSNVGASSVNPKVPLNGISGASVGHPRRMIPGGDTPGNGLLPSPTQGGEMAFDTLMFDPRMRSAVGVGGGIGLSSGEVAPVVAPGNNGGTVANASEANTAYDGVGGGVPGGGVPVKGRFMDTGPSRQAFNFGDPRQDTSSALWALYEDGDMSDNEVMGMEVGLVGSTVAWRTRSMVVSVSRIVSRNACDGFPRPFFMGTKRSPGMIMKPGARAL